MKHHYKKPDIYTSMYGQVYKCNHTVYDLCTLFKIEEKGLAIIQQRFDSKTKRTYWSDIDPWLTYALYLNKHFLEYFNRIAECCSDEGIYPTVTIRQIMWGLKMKPLPKEPWETVFDRRII